MLHARQRIAPTPECNTTDIDTSSVCRSTRSTLWRLGSRPFRQTPGDQGMPSFRNYLLSTAFGAARDGQSNRPRRGRSECSRWPQLPACAVDQRGRHPFRRPDQLDQEPPPSSNFTKLAGHGVVYPSAYTTAPSDSYPGMLAQVTGATPKNGGLFYDDSYDRKEHPSKDSYTRRGLPDPGWCRHHRCGRATTRR